MSVVLQRHHFQSPNVGQRWGKKLSEFKVQSGFYTVFKARWNYQKMYNIYAPKGYHGILGRRIQQELCKDRAKRAECAKKSKIKQYISKGVSKKKIEECEDCEDCRIHQ